MPEPTSSAATPALNAARDDLTRILERLTGGGRPDYGAGSYGRQRAKREALRQLPAVRAALDAATATLVAELRTTPFGTWDEIGETLGISKQAARERFRRHGVP